MSATRRLPRVKGKKQISRFCEQLRILRPHLSREYLKTIQEDLHSRDRRNTALNTLEVFQEFSDEELRKIRKKVYQVNIPWKRIFVCVGAFLALFFIFLWVRFTNRPRVYTYKNNVPVYLDSAGGAGKLGQMDIYGESYPLNGAPGPESGSTMVLVDSTGPYVEVEPDNFLSWLTPGQPTGFVKRDDLLLSKKDYEEYKSFFRALRGEEELFRLPNDLRPQIMHTIKSSTVGQAAIADDYPDSVRKAGYSKLATSKVDRTSYVFLRLATKEGSRNYVIRLSDTGSLVNELMDINGQPMRQAGFFMEQKSAFPPDILFHDLSSGRIRKSVIPPYLNFQ